MITVGYICISLCLASKEYYEAARKHAVVNCSGIYIFVISLIRSLLQLWLGLQSVAI